MNHREASHFQSHNNRKVLPQTGLLGRRVSFPQYPIMQKQTFHACDLPYHIPMSYMLPLKLLVHAHLYIMKNRFQVLHKELSSFEYAHCILEFLSYMCLFVLNTFLLNLSYVYPFVLKHLTSKFIKCLYIFIHL